jgi:hypothetical protein
MPTPQFAKYSVFNIFHTLAVALWRTLGKREAVSLPLLQLDITPITVHSHPGWYSGSSGSYGV